MSGNMFSNSSIINDMLYSKKEMPKKSRVDEDIRLHSVESVMGKIGKTNFLVVNAFHQLIMGASVDALSKCDSTYSVDDYLRDRMTEVAYQSFSSTIEFFGKDKGYVNVEALLPLDSFWEPLRTTFSPGDFFLHTERDSKRSESSRAISQVLFTEVGTSYLRGYMRYLYSYSRFMSKKRFIGEDLPLFTSPLLKGLRLVEILKLPALFVLLLVAGDKEDSSVNFSSLVDAYKNSQSNYELKLTLHGFLTQHRQCPSINQAFMVLDGSFYQPADSFESLPWGETHTVSLTPDTVFGKEHLVLDMLMSNSVHTTLPYAKTYSRLLAENFSGRLYQETGNFKSMSALANNVASSLLWYFSKARWLDDAISPEQDSNAGGFKSTFLSKEREKYADNYDGYIDFVADNLDPSSYVLYLWDKVYRLYSEPINPYYQILVQDALGAGLGDYSKKGKHLVIEAKTNYEAVHGGHSNFLESVGDKEVDEAFKALVRIGSFCGEMPYSR